MYEFIDADPISDGVPKSVLVTGLQDHNHQTPLYANALFKTLLIFSQLESMKPIPTHTKIKPKKMRMHTSNFEDNPFNTALSEKHTNPEV